MLCIRMRRTGSKKRPFYRLVVTEARSPREGSFLEVLGFYDPRSRPSVLEVDKARIDHWVSKGARPSDSVRTLLARHVTKDRSAAVEPVEAAPTAPPA
jgi:small subunit ribosomal protein S16